MRNHDQFFARCLIRIVPPYWVGTLAVLAIAKVMSTLHTPRALTFRRCSPVRETAYADMFPTLIRGWSLNF